MKTTIVSTVGNVKLGLLGFISSGVSFSSLIVFTENALRLIGTLAGAITAVVSLYLLLKRNRLWPFDKKEGEK